MKIRIPYVDKYRYLGNVANVRAQRDASWSNAIAKAKRLENQLSKALRGARVIPVIQKV